MDATPYEDWLVDLRRELHQYPEPAWREFWTTARIVGELRDLGVEDIKLGPEIMEPDARASVPEASELEGWLARAREHADETGVDNAILDELEGGYTGVLATIERGEGPTIGLRVDIDGLPRAESTDGEHVPAVEGFRSTNEGYMHACGHDAHATIGLGVIRAIMESDFQGTLKVVFQPAEELVAGAKPIAESGVLDDVKALLAIHIGLDHPTGEVVAGVGGFLAVSHLYATFEGEPAHAGGHPNRGRNAVQAMATAVQNLYGIPRHEDGETRINAGQVGGGSATNIIPEEAFIHGEVRGETTELMEYTRDRATTIVEAAADMHECAVEIDYGATAPSAESDAALLEHVAAVADENARVTSLLDRDELGGSEDASYLMTRVQEHGGLATFVGIGTDHPGGHHTASFDVDEESLLIGVEVIGGAIERLGGPDSPLLS